MKKLEGRYIPCNFYGAKTSLQFFFSQRFKKSHLIYYWSPWLFTESVCKFLLPGIDRQAVMETFAQRGRWVFFSLLNTFTGGALEQFSILALGIIPLYYRFHYFSTSANRCAFFRTVKKRRGIWQEKNQSIYSLCNSFTGYISILWFVSGFFWK